MPENLSSIEALLDQAGLILPEAKAPIGAYVPFVQTGNLLMISGQGPVNANGVAITGRLGYGLEIEDGTRAAQIAGLNIVAQIKAALEGDFSRLTRIIRLSGYVNASASFTHHAAVLNGASELMVDLFGERGRHARAAIGVASLPMNWAVEIDAIIEIA